MNVGTPWTQALLPLEQAQELVGTSPRDHAFPTFLCLPHALLCHTERYGAGEPLNQMSINLKTTGH